MLDERFKHIGSDRKDLYFFQIIELKLRFLLTAGVCWLRGVPQAVGAPAEGSQGS